jgi:hypothetical protein
LAVVLVVKLLQTMVVLVEVRVKVAVVLLAQEHQDKVTMVALKEQ